MDVLKKQLRVTMPDGSKYDVPVEMIVANRVESLLAGLALVTQDDEEEAQRKTIALFADDYEIQDWAANNMDWADVRGSAIKVEKACGVDFDEGWVNGEKEIVD